MIRPEQTSPTLATNLINQRPTLSAEDVLLRCALDGQLDRVDRLWDRWERTGEEKWMAAAIEADRLYRRMKERLS